MMKEYRLKVEDELFKAIKMTAAELDLTINEVITDMIRACLSRHDPITKEDISEE